MLTEAKLNPIPPCEIVGVTRDCVLWSTCMMPRTIIGPFWKIKMNLLLRIWKMEFSSFAKFTERYVTVRFCTLNMADATITLSWPRIRVLCTSPQVVMCWAVMHTAQIATNTEINANFILHKSFHFFKSNAINERYALRCDRKPELDTWFRATTFIIYIQRWAGNRSIESD